MVLSFLKKTLAKDAAARTPPGQRIYAVGDIHGRADLLDRLMAGIEKDLASFKGERFHLIFLGDYIDRGPDSAAVIDKLIGIQKRMPTARFLMGNHEEAMRRFMDNPLREEAWLDYGGVETLESYRVAPPMPRQSQEALMACGSNLVKKLPEAHRRFFDRLELCLTLGDYFFCHAGVKPGVPLDEQDPADLLWIRQEFLSSDWEPGKVIVHGHTPSEEPSIGPWRIGVDTGAYATGRLTCAVLEDDDRRFLSTAPRHG